MAQTTQAIGPGPHVCFSWGLSGQVESTIGALNAPSVHLAYGAEGGIQKKMVEGLAGNLQIPAVLVSFVYLRGFEQNRHRFRIRHWVMDSGAFSAHNAGTTIDLQEYIETAQRLLSTDPQLREVYSLDVIGDWRASIKNTRKMIEAGIPAIPCYHVDEPEDVLIGMAKEFPKIALGGVALFRSKQKLEWAKQCFARVWPKKIHGFAFASKRALLALPWHSVDSTTWESGPCRFGNWLKYGKMSVKGSNQNLKAEVAHYLEAERLARHRWRKEMELLESEGNPHVHFATGSGRMGVFEDEGGDDGDRAENR